MRPTRIRRAPRVSTIVALRSCVGCMRSGLPRHRRDLTAPSWTGILRPIAMSSSVSGVCFSARASMGRGCWTTGKPVLSNGAISCAHCPSSTCSTLASNVSSDEEEMTLMVEVADDIAFALHDIRTDRLRREGEERLRVVHARLCGLSAVRSRTCAPSILQRFAALRPAFSPCPLICGHTSTPRDAQARARQSSIPPASSSSQSPGAGGSMPSQSLGGARASGSGSGSTPTAQAGIGSPVTSKATVSAWPNCVVVSGNARCDRMRSMTSCRRMTAIVPRPRRPLTRGLGDALGPAQVRPRIENRRTQEKPRRSHNRDTEPTTVGGRRCAQRLQPGLAGHEPCASRSAFA